MTLNALLHFVAALLCGGLAALGLRRDYRSFAHRVFALGMIALAAEALLTGLSIQTIHAERAMLLQKGRCLSTAMLPGLWVLFALSFPQGSHRPSLGTWKWVLLGVFAVPLLCVTFLDARLFRTVSLSPDTGGWLLQIGWAGYVLTCVYLVGMVILLMLLERALRAARGHQRWEVKFLVLGIGPLFATRIFTTSHALLVHGIHLELEIVNAVSLVVGGSLILVALHRAPYLHTRIYLSQTLLHRSLTLLAVGVYLLVVAFFAKVLDNLTGRSPLPLQSLFVFLAFLGLAVTLLSDRVRLSVKRAISRHLHRPQYDYREAWMAFTERTASLIETKALCQAVCRMISEMFDTLAVTLWLVDEPGGQLHYGGSTALSEEAAREVLSRHHGGSPLLERLDGKQPITDLGALSHEASGEAGASAETFFHDARIRFCLPLRIGDELVAVVTLADRVRGVPLSFEEIDMLATIGHQVAASLYNLKLSRRLQEAKEIADFQRIAAAFVHDLKNLASRLSLLLQNMPLHFDNPSFREDALLVMSRSVEKIEDMCSRMSLLGETQRLRPIEANLSQVVSDTVDELRPAFNGRLVDQLQPVPSIMGDPDQISKVLTNLILNANDATGGVGEIRVSTGIRDKWAVLTVADDGCGMSREFMDQSLFRPFKTTKDTGTGIGLFQTRMIMDSHQGKIEVESREGKGTTFRILFPLQRIRPTQAKWQGSGHVSQHP
jgi:putative PEP-CTERM system histidine kinase